MGLLDQTMTTIGDLNQQVMAEIRRRQDNLTKPQGSLGVLEEISVQIGNITGNPLPEINKKAVVVIAAGHGVAAEGVSGQA